MKRNDVVDKINAVIKDKLLIDLNILSDEDKSISLLSSKIGLRPRDLVAIFKELESAFDINFTNEDVTESRFDIYNNIVDSVMKQAT